MLNYLKLFYLDDSEKKQQVQFNLTEVVDRQHDRFLYRQDGCKMIT